jgi:folylpolyglutamate synthase
LQTCKPRREVSFDTSSRYKAIDLTHLDSKAVQRILIFNQQTRDAPALANALYQTLSTALSSATPFTHCIFTTNITFKEAEYKPDLAALNANPQDIKALKVQNELATVWSELDTTANVAVTGTIEEAVDAAKKIADDSGVEVMTLITGSLHLVGGAFDVLESRGVT